MIDKVICNVKRNFYLSDVIGIKGKVVEEKDKFICYVDKNSINQLYNTEVYNLSLKGFKDSDSRIEKYCLNKIVYYIFENIDFDDSVEIFANLGTHVIFRNCSFKKKYRNLFGG